MFPLSPESRVALITGAAQGIGRCLAEGFAEAGYLVYALDKQQGTFSHAHIRSRVVDVSSSDALQLCFDSILAESPQLHVLINNAACAHEAISLASQPVETLQAVLATNLLGSMMCSQHFIRANAGCGYGRIIHMSSTRHQQNEADWEAYGASKGGLVSLTQSLCVSLSSTPITVNCIIPGWIHTGDATELREVDHLQHPSGRVGEPADILRACLFLCEAENDFINGASLTIDGGMSKRMFYAE